MRRLLRYVSIGIILLVAVVYIGIMVFLAYNENAVVFNGAALDNECPSVPADTVTIAWDSVRVQADDRVPVFLLSSRLENREDAPWIIFFHGNGELLGARNYVERYRLLRDAGFNVLAMEYRGYGISGSAGMPSKNGVYTDARAAGKYLTKQMKLDLIVLCCMVFRCSNATCIARPSCGSNHRGSLYNIAS